MLTIQRFVYTHKDKLSVIKFQVDLIEPELRKGFVKEMEEIEKDKREPIKYEF